MVYLLHNASLAAETRISPAREKKLSLEKPLVTIYKSTVRFFILERCTLTCAVSKINVIKITENLNVF